jgi:hypothetical protein
MCGIICNLQDLTKIELGIVSNKLLMLTTLLKSFLMSKSLTVGGLDSGDASGILIIFAQVLRFCFCKPLTLLTGQ